MKVLNSIIRKWWLCCSCKAKVTLIGWVENYQIWRNTRVFLQLFIYSATWAVTCVQVYFQTSNIVTVSVRRLEFHKKVRRIKPNEWLNFTTVTHIRFVTIIIIIIIGPWWNLWRSILVKPVTGIFVTNTWRFHDAKLCWNPWRKWTESWVWLKSVTTHRYSVG